MYTNPNYSYQNLIIGGIYIKKNNLRSKIYVAAISVAVVLGVIVTAVPVTTNAAGTSFTDVKPTLDHYDSIINIAGRGIVKGYSEGTFRPESRLTRGPALKMDTKSVKIPGFKNVDKANGFYKYGATLENAGLISGIDVSNSAWYVDHVKTLVNNKVTKGKTATTSNPNASLPLAQMTSFVARAENKKVASNPTDKARAKIRKVVTQNGVIEVGGKKVAESKFDSRTNTLTMTTYDIDEGLKGIIGIGVFSGKLQSLGVNKIRIGNAKAVNLSQSTAKDALKEDFLDLLKPSTKPSTDSDVSAEDVQVTLYADKDGIQFRETFNVDFHVFVPSTK